MTGGLAIAAVVLLCATLALGATVAHRPPTAIDVAAFALRGQAVPLALFFTMLGRWYAVLPVGVLAFGVGMAARANLVPLLVVVAAQVASQATNALLKLAFHRTRPDVFLGTAESDLSFPSGHAVTAVVFFAGLAILAWHAPLPRPLAAAATVLLAICAIGIPWSRLALGAHYFTDVVGGLMFGAAWLCVALIVIARLGATATR